MGGRFWISGVVTFVVITMGGFLIHGTILQADYEAQRNLMRPETDVQTRFHWMFVANLAMAFAFTWIYRKGREPGKPWLGQGLRFGVALACAFAVPMYLIYYVVQPWPESMVVKQIALEFVMALVTGVVLAAINRDRR
jgi:hypothetical protein